MRSRRVVVGVTVQNRERSTQRLESSAALQQLVAGQFEKKHLDAGREASALARIAVRHRSCLLGSFRRANVPSLYNVVGDFFVLSTGFQLTVCCTEMKVYSQYLAGHVS